MMERDGANEDFRILVFHSQGTTLPPSDFEADFVSGDLDGHL
jgi:hypothetical protein